MEDKKWKKYAVEVVCPKCKTTYLAFKYRLKDNSGFRICKSCVSRENAPFKKGMKQSASTIQKRTETNKSKGITARLIANLAKNNIGRKASAEHRKSISNALRGRRPSDQCMEASRKSVREGWKNGLFSNTRIGYGKSGKRSDLNNTFFRSRWEANIARVFDRLGVIWEFEKYNFELSNGAIYIPDFKVSGGWVEVKGYMRPDGIEKINLFRIDYPQEKLTIIDQKSYKEIELRWKDKIPQWE